MKRCAIVQFEPRHEEVVPSLVAACNAIGYRPRVFLHRRILKLRGDIMALVPNLEFDVEYLPLSTPDYRAADAPHDFKKSIASIEATETEFILMASLIRPKAAIWAHGVKKPLIMVLHNLDQFSQISSLRETLEMPNARFIGLSAHVTAEWISRMGKAHMDRIATLEPFYWIDDPAPRLGQPRQVVIPGNINLRTRDYRGLLEFLSKRPSAFQNLHFILPSGGADRAIVESEIMARRLDSRFTCVPVGKSGQVGHAAYFDALASAQVIHPLMPDDYEQYQRIKITSAISSSGGFCVPIIMDRWSEACYRPPMLVADNSLEASLTRIADASDTELQDLQAALKSYRRTALASGADGLKRLLEQ